MFDRIENWINRKQPEFFMKLVLLEFCILLGFIIILVLAEAATDILTGLWKQR